MQLARTGRLNAFGGEGVQVLAFYCSRRYKKQRQNAFYQKQSALNHLAKVVTGEQRDAPVLVAYGSASVGSCVRGNPPIGAKAFLRRLQQRCRVCMVDEFRTSQVCCLADCNGVLTRMTGHVWDRSQQPHVRRRFQFWAVQTCNVCGTVWNRDRNASVNILRVFRSICETGERPAPFRRQ
jgi:hypothetical protein